MKRLRDEPKISLGLPRLDIWGGRPPLGMLLSHKLVGLTPFVKDRKILTFHLASAP